VKLNSGIKDGEYLERLREALLESFKQFTPDCIIYNAGTDILEGDPLGNMCISEDGILQRDEMVFRYEKGKRREKKKMQRHSYLFSLVPFFYFFLFFCPKKERHSRERFQLQCC
jgi:hypothetical protein